MIDETDLEFHERRARAELDLAYRCENRPSMIAHLRLSSLHMARLRALLPVPRVARCRLIGDPASAAAMPGWVRQAEQMGEADLVAG
jgi:hypothetical protein